MQYYLFRSARGRINMSQTVLPAFQRSSLMPRVSFIMLRKISLREDCWRIIVVDEPSQGCGPAGRHYVTLNFGIRRHSDLLPRLLHGLKSFYCSTRDARLTMCHSRLCQGLIGCILRQDASRKDSSQQNYFQPEGFDSVRHSSLDAAASAAKRSNARHLRQLAPIGGVPSAQMTIISIDSPVSSVQF